MFKWLAFTRLISQQKIVLKELANKRKSFFRTIGESFSDDEDFLQANMMSPAFGTEVLRRQVENERKEKDEIQQLIEKCKEAGISEWRINLVT